MNESVPGKPSTRFLATGKAHASSCQSFPNDGSGSHGHVPYRGQFPSYRRAARWNELLNWLGFSNVVRKPDETVTSSTPDTVEGYILSRAADVYGRCISLVGRGAPPQADGSDVFVDGDVLRTTANHHLISMGLAYPTYYRALFPDLRKELTAASKQARDGGLGVWAKDATTTGFDVTGLDVLQDDIVIVPKLFRRLVEYLHLGDSSMAGFRAFLDQAGDRFFILSTGHSTTGLDAVVEVDGDKVKMTRPIEDLVFDEK
jgi:hypothetical protein